VRRRSRSRYQLPIESDNVNSQRISELTRRAFYSNEPWRYISAYDFRRPVSHYSHSNFDGLSSDLAEDFPKQVIWYNDGLYNSCRCALVSPIVREGSSARRSPNAPHFLHIGVIKIENRSLSCLPGFSESSARESSQNALFFSPLWEITALRPYIRDLQRAVKNDHDPFLPLHNNVGWQQYFDDHPQGSKYYHQLLRELRRRRKLGSITGQAAQVLASSYARLAQWLQSLLEVLIRLEAWIQHLGFACRVACRLTPPPSLDRPVASLFDIHNIAAAYSERFDADVPAVPSVSRDAGSAFSAVRQAVLTCVSSRGSPQRRQFRQFRQAMEALSSIIDTAARLSTRVHRSLTTGEDGGQNPVDLARLQGEFTALVKVLRSWAEVLDRISKVDPKWVGIRDRFERLPLVAGTIGDAHSQALNELLALLAEVRSVAEREAEDMIQELCESRALEMSTRLFAGCKDFDIVTAIDAPPPAWDFKGALEIVLADVKSIADFLASRKLREPDHHYELLSEEIELTRILEAVRSVLNGDIVLEKQYAVSCSHPVPDHKSDDLGALGCRAARVMSAATMFADSFNEIDKKRLTFIASHVAQVIDNHLLQQARQRRIEIDYTAIDTLGLERFTLSLLDLWGADLRRISHVLYYLRDRDAFRLGEENVHVGSNLLSVKHFIESMATFQTGRKKGRFTCSCLRMWSQHGNQSEIVESILSAAGSMPSLIVRRVRSKIVYCYDAASSLKDSPFVELQLRTTKQVGADEIDFTISLPRKLLIARDVRALWHITRIISSLAQACERTVTEP
jgi:hypothetical protein